MITSMLNSFPNMRGSKKIVPDQLNSQRTEWTSFENQLDPRGSNCFSRGSVPEFLRNPIATSDFPGGPDPMSAQLDMPMPNIY